MTSLAIKNATVQAGSRVLLENISLSVEAGEVVSVIGPNGAGKSTIVRALAGDQPLKSGCITLNGRSNWTPKQQANMLAVLLQSSSLSFSFTALEVVLLGRIPADTSHSENVKIAKSALSSVDALHLLGRRYTTLSGGECQRVHMARVLAQIWHESELGSRFLLLDEPTSALDLAHQQLTLECVRQFAGRGVGVLVVLHDLNLSARYSDRIVAVASGKKIAQGVPDEVLTEESIRSVFGVAVTLSKHPVHNCPLIIGH